MLAFLLLAALQTLPLQPTDMLAPIMVYNGTWTVRAEHPFGGRAAGAVDTLTNHCTHFAAFVSCEQVVNGTPAALVVYVPGDGPGQFHTQTVLPSGLATGRAEMTIKDAHWTYSNQPAPGEKSTLYRTENYFEGRDKIRFEQYESGDGTTWTKTNEGSETRNRN